MADRVEFLDQPADRPVAAVDAHAHLEAAYDDRFELDGVSQMIVGCGRTVVTSAVNFWVQPDDTRMVWLAGCVARHLHGDWGDLDTHDRPVNGDALRRGRGRLLSAYQVPADLAGTTAEKQVWVITDDLENPDTATTILWPRAY